MERSTAGERSWQLGLRRETQSLTFFKFPLKMSKLKKSTGERKKDISACKTSPSAVTAALQAYLLNDVDAKNSNLDLFLASVNNHNSENNVSLDERRLSNISTNIRQSDTKRLEITTPTQPHVLINTNKEDDVAPPATIPSLQVESPLSRFRKQVRFRKKKLQCF